MYERLRQIARIVQSGTRFLLSSHVNPDGDSVGSSCALQLLLSRLGKQVTTLFQHQVPGQYSFVPGADRIRWGDSVQNVSPDDQTIGVILDCSELPRTGEDVSRVMAQCRHLIVIDHHSTSERDTDLVDASPDEPDIEPTRTILVDSTAAATGELVYLLVRELLCEVPADIATALYVAISTDTGSFRYSNTTSQSLRIAADLVEAGASPGSISEVVYDTRPLGYLRFLADALGRLETAAGGRIAYLVVTGELLRAYGARHDELEGLVNYARMVDSAACAILFSPGAPGEVKVSFRCKGGFRVDSIAAHFGGGGHRCASGARVKGQMDDVVRSVISYASQALEGYGD